MVVLVPKNTPVLQCPVLEVASSVVLVPPVRSLFAGLCGLVLPSGVCLVLVDRLCINKKVSAQSAATGLKTTVVSVLATADPS